MAIKIFEGKAVAVAQVSTIQVTAYDAATTYTLKVNGVTLAESIAAGTANDAAAALAAAWEASAHPYCTAITATAATDTVTFTADVAEPPFTVAGSVAGGTGTIGSFTTTTTPTGPRTLSEPENWSGEALPSNGDELIFRDMDAPVLWDLDGLSTTGHIVHWEDSALGFLGLDPAEFALNADGTVVSEDAREYRAVALELDMAEVYVGEHEGLGSPGGSRRVNLKNTRASASTFAVQAGNDSGDRLGRPAITYNAAHASADIEIKGGSVGVGTLVPGETGTVGDINLIDGRAQLGAGMTVSGNFTQSNGESNLTVSVATLAAATVYDGVCALKGDQAITTLNVHAGNVTPTTTGTITTVNHYGGEVDYRESAIARTVTTHKLYSGGGASVDWNDDVMTITMDFDTGPHELTVA